MVAFEQLRRDKCTLDVVHEAFSVGRTKPSLVLVALDRWNGISYDDDKEFVAPAIDPAAIVNDHKRGLKRKFDFHGVRLRWSWRDVGPRQRKLMSG